MSREDVDLVVRLLHEFKTTHGPPGPELVAPDFVWDMSEFHG